MTKNGCCDGMDLNKKAKASFKKIVGRYFRGQDIKTHTTVKIPCHILNGTRSTWWKGWFMVYTTTTVFTKMWPVSECVACGAWCVSWLLTCSLTSSLSVKLFYRMSHINSCGCCWVHLIPAPLVCVCLSVGPGNVSRVLRYLEPPPANCSGVINLHNGPVSHTCAHLYSPDYTIAYTANAAVRYSVSHYSLFVTHHAG